MNPLSWIKAKSNLIALGICAASACAWMVILWHRYYEVNSGEWDGAVHAQTLWSLAHGSLYNSLLGDNFLVEHCTLLSFFVAPLHATFSHPLLLQYLKVISFFSGAYLFFLILKQRFPAWLALMGMIAFSVTPANIGMLRFAFNYEPFAIPLIFLIFLSFEKKQYITYIISCFLLALVKEQMPLVVMGFGIWAFFCRKEERIRFALIPFLMGAFIFSVEVFVLTPYVRQGLPDTGGYYWQRYALHSPQDLWQRICSQDSIHWYKEIFGFSGWLSLLDPWTLLPALPLLIKAVFSQRAIERSLVDYYYAASLMPFIFLAAVAGAERIRPKWRLTLVSLMFTGMLLWAFTYWPHWNLPSYPETGKANWMALQKLSMEIDKDASVLVTDEALTPLSNRRNIYQLDSYLWGTYQISGKPFKLPADLDYILIDLGEQKRLLTADQGHQFIEKLSALNFSSQWTVKNSLEEVLLLSRCPSNQKPQHLIETSDQPFLKEQSENLSDPVILEEVREGKFQNGILPLELYWRDREATSDIYNVRIIIRKGVKIFYYQEHPAGSMLYPNSFWKKGEYVKERFSCWLPGLAQGEYTLQVQAYNSQTHVYDALSHQWVDCVRKDNVIQGKYPLYQCVPATKGPLEMSKSFKVF